MFVSIPGSIRPVRFEPAGTVPDEISIPAVTHTQIRRKKSVICRGCTGYPAGRISG